MNSISINNKRIAKNTLFLYFRQILVMAVSLYTVRVTLAALGIQDYGIFNVVGGFVAMFGILSGSLSISIGRFINYEMGREDCELSKLKSIFASSLLIQLCSGMIIFLLLSTLGVWFVQYELVMPAERMNAAIYVLLFSSISFFINLLTVPFNALIIAHEQMKAFAYISIIEAVMKLLVAFLLLEIVFDKLILYGFCMVIVNLIIGISYCLYCKFHFVEFCIKAKFEKRLLKKMFSFAGWAFLGNGSFVIKEHGTNLLLNMFCGPAVNAARGVTTQVTTAVTMFINNFMQAVNPQIMKSFSSGDLSNMRKLIFTSSRFSFYLMLVLSLPLMKNIDYVLDLWLVSVPEHTGIFIQLLFVFCLMDCLVQPLMIGLLAEGNIRTYEIILVFLNSLNVLFSYFALKNGFIPECVYIISIIVELAIAWVRIKLSSLAYQLPIKEYCLNVLLKALIISIILGGFTFYINLSIENLFLNFVFVTVLIVLFSLVTIYYGGLEQKERSFVFSLVKKKLRF